MGHLHPRLSHSSPSGTPPRGRSNLRWIVALATLAVALLAAERASAQPTLRHQNDQHGDFVVFGNSSGYDCGSGTPAPVVGAVTCGSSVSDSSPDVLWQADAPTAGNATADPTITSAQARSTAMLALPANAVITYARLYWAAMLDAAQPDTSVVVERPGVSSQTLSADVSHAVDLSTAPALIQYEASADVTDLVRVLRDGAYRVSGIGTLALDGLNDSRAFVAWSVVVLYEVPGDPLRQLTVFDGLDLANSGSGIEIGVSGFLVPQSGIDAKVGIVAYGGDGQTGGDSLSFNGTALTDGVDSTNNFFNASRTWLGTAVSNLGDLPQLTGGSRSMSGVDMDVVDVTTLVAPGSTSALVGVKAGGDNNVLVGVLVTSITTFEPNFNDSIKTVTDLNGGLALPGDTLRYEIQVINTGNDPGIGVILEDALPTQVTFVPDSIAIVSGPGAGAKTDPTGDDQGEYDGTLRLVRIRLGTGANATVGGTIGIGESSTVAFDVVVNSGVTGTISNQATIHASGLRGSPLSTYTSDDGTGSGPTTVSVDQCQNDAGCPAAKPRCYNPPQAGLPNVCVECLSAADCGGVEPICDSTHTCAPCASDAECAAVDPQTPACQPSGALAGSCTQCSASNPSLCGGTTPECLASLGVCGCSSTDGDSECGAVDSGIICNGPAGECVPGCSKATGRNDCPSSQYCSDQTGAVGVCRGQPCNVDGDCSSPLPRCYTAPEPNECVQCITDSDCPSSMLCNTNHACVECLDGADCQASGSGTACLPNGTCGCTTDPDCGASDSGRVCDTAASTCTTGCRGTGGNGCPTGEVCTSTDSSIGSCVECVTDADCGGTTPYCNVARHSCVECVTSAQCSNSAPVCQTDGTCGACTSDADCTDSTAPACQVSGPLLGQCTECSGTNDTLCSGDRPMCLAQLGFCGCSSTDGDSECGASDSGIVCSGAQGTCVPGCSTASGRNDCPTILYCSDQTGAVGTCLTHCTSNADCTSPQVCDMSSIPHVCVDCITDADCGTGQVCDEPRRVCVGCLVDADCPTGQVCDATSNTCVACVDDTDCPTGQLCDEPNHTCVGCVDDSNCPAPNVCDGTTQTCVGCVDDTDCTTPFVCDPSTQTCVGCVDNTDCPAPTVCDPTTQTCVGCTTSADCAGDQVCDPTTKTCVGCLTDADCAAGQYCDTTTQTCGECAPSAPDACTGNPNGTACLPNDTCGCNTDADCATGTICDGTTDHCVEGCRPGAADVCPSGMECVATNDAGNVGECAPIANLDQSLAGGGCACSAPGGASGSSSRWALVTLALGLGLARRRVKAKRRS
jgi:uncharacterized repeat protein (TIGR01451 family)/MYXO-CTERM domain-containing protein